MGLGISRRRDWEATFAAWALPPSQTEMEKCERAVSAIKRAIDASPLLTQRSVTPFAQGSFANRTNVRQDSDVDVCVFSTAACIYDFPAGVTLQSMGIPTTPYTFALYKAEVHIALEAHFGPRHVERGNKAFDIHENTYRIDADAAPCFEYRLYYHDERRQLRFVKGTALIPDKEGRRITNFPDQQYANGVAKNDATNRRFKALVRIIKKLRNEMADARIPAAEPMASFLIESLVWNWPSELFAATDSWTATAKGFLSYIWDATRPGMEVLTQHWRETNNIKSIFGPSSAWTREQVNAFTLAAYGYVDGR